MSNNILKYPAIYKHFKGKYYASMGVSKPIDISTIDKNLEFLKAFHTETHRPMYIIIDDKGEWYHNKNHENDVMILYKSLYDDTGVYARPINMFLSKVDVKKYPNVDQEFRFELVKYNLV